MSKFISLVLLCVVSVASHAQPPIGLQMGSFGKQLRADLPGTLKKMKDLGITEVEGGGTFGMAPDAYKKLLQEHGIKVVAIGANFDSLQRNPSKYVQLARQVDAVQVVCYWIPHTGDNFTAEDAKGGDRIQSGGKGIVG
jgi:sugar phosphate isomerase/epimerase